MGIAYRNAPSANRSATFTALENRPCTVCAPTAPDDRLPSDSVPGWALARRPEMSFDVPDDGDTLEHADVVRASHAVTVDSCNGWAPKVALLKLTEDQ